MIGRLALWLAEITDRWARAVAGDDGPEQLAALEEAIEVWTVDNGRLVDRSFFAPVIFIDEYAMARNRHPAGKRL